MIDEERMKILTDGAKYDVSCSSSGSRRKNTKDGLGNASLGGICHSFTQDGRCISLLKMLMTNDCVFDCKYCPNRRSADVPRAVASPEEMCELVMAFYRRNYIEGLFLSSGIQKNPDYTMEQMYQTIYLLRTKYKFNGYIHVKAIPGADPLLIEKTGWLADRMSANMELPTAKGLDLLAPQKSRKKILTPMRQIQIGRSESLLLQDARTEKRRRLSLYQSESQTVLPAVSGGTLQEFHQDGRFVPAGQSTQMIIGATKETDYEIVHMAQALYQQFDLKRVFYSAFVNTTGDSHLPDTKERGPELLREHRLYQADFLMRFYQFRADEIITKENPNLNVSVDPKCNWALYHLDSFPVEVEKADYHTLLRVPGIGVKSARRIIMARRRGTLDFNALKKFGVVLKRAMYFITCHGHMMVPIRLNRTFILANLLGLKERLPKEIEAQGTGRQMMLEDVMQGW
mgnify:FL=1